MKTKQEFLEIADRLGRELCRDALWDSQGRCTWLGWEMEAQAYKTWHVYRSMPACLYDGNAGIALFLIELYQFTGDLQVLRIIDGAINQIRSVLPKIAPAQKHALYTGYVGIIHTFLRAAEVLQRDDLREEALALVIALSKEAISRQHLDVVNGSAGAIPRLLSIARRNGSQAARDLAYQHGQNLLDSLVENERGYSWPTVTMPVQANLVGYSHGTAGLMVALLDLYRDSGEVRFHDAALQALRYENSYLDTEVGNWRDLRIMSSTQMTSDNFYLGWCHGAPGIGLSRLFARQVLPENPVVQSDLELCLQTSCKSLSSIWIPGQGNYSLCHGASGNAELLIAAGQYLSRPDLIAVAEHVGEQGIRCYSRQGLPWPCGNGGSGTTPNLMLGLAGIGHFYLRLYNSQKVPSVLLIVEDF
ncbi:lanthionine synthetase LanC family protein [Undibacterium fentianense]|uniref:Lanthionine synthetase C-like protein n=1 Tax=Undibacterium fentianense TaxID=2828728 RepID=A0A941E2P8_9BURK|nr:lanthionine synthetase LanC family protein [Undibacterium fentianense]MBR7799559.1 hypothetical protein [Undibacterium fentianense]